MGLSFMKTKFFYVSIGFPHTCGWQGVFSAVLFEELPGEGFCE